ncbi:uncharacterized protein [Watersipora subatra]|uniref:uncharacterized protein n=1 Tax=Watersipora subatra TaxID=2589382 RepID=UPI00355C3393
MTKLLTVLGLGLYLLQWISAQDFNNCITIANCLLYFEGSCNAAGERQVCISWATVTGCDHDAAAADRVCRANDFSSSQSLPANTQFCNAPDQLAMGGSLISFGIDDGVRPATGSGATAISVLGYNTADGRAAVMCSDFVNVCANNGLNDIRLTFQVGACPGQTTTTTTTTTEVMPPGCMCDPWIDITPCSVTCGTGTRLQIRTCRNCPAGTLLTQTVSCTAPRPCSIDGMWGAWMNWSACVGPCNPQGTRTRSRVCNNPLPQGPDARSCVGPATQIENCFAIPPCGPVPPPPPPPGPPGPPPGPPGPRGNRRRCRRAAKNSCPRRRRGRQCRVRFIRSCLRNGPRG